MLLTQVLMDADTHVDECEDTWSYFPQDKRDLMPRTIEFTPDQEPEGLLKPSGSHHSRMWFIDGQVIPRRYRNDERTGTTQETRELRDVRARIADMDELKVGIHVLYPSAFLAELTLRPDLSMLLCQSYNRWLADRCAVSGGRLRWIAMLPLLSIPDSLSEMRWAKEHGACGVFKRGVECGNLLASDPLFFPIYELASQLDLPIVIHSAAEWRPRNINLTTFPVPHGFEGLRAFCALVDAKIPTRFPELRVGFIEFGAAWLPHVLPFIGCKASLAEMRFFVTCLEYEDLNYIIDKVGDENLMVGSDYTHADRASVRDAPARVMNRSDIGSTSAVKITSTNTKVFYRL